MQRMGSSRIWSFIAGVLVLAAAGVSVYFHSRYEAVQKERGADTARIRELEGQLALARAEVSEYQEKLQAAEQIADDLEREREAKERLAMVHAARIGELEEQLEVLSRTKPPDNAGETPDTRTAGEADEVAAEAIEAAEAEGATPLAEEVETAEAATTEPSAAENGAASASATTPAAEISREELEHELEAARAEKAELERKHAALVASGGVPIGEVRVTTGLRIKGKVLLVNTRYNFVVMDVGARDGVETGMVLILHRGKKFVGKCQVVKVYSDKAAADLVLDWMKDEVVAGDSVRKF